MLRPTMNIGNGVEANRIYGAPECDNLPLYDDGTQCLSCWTMTWRERLSVLLHGRVWLCVSGKQPPVWLAATEKEAVGDN